MTTGLGFVEKNGVPVFDNVIFNAQLKKLKHEEENEYKNSFGLSKSDKSKKIDGKQSQPKASNELDQVALLKIAMEMSKPSSLDKDKTAETANMMVASANMGASNKFVKSIEELMDLNQVIHFQSLQGKDVEAYKPLNAEEAEKYLDRPDEKPTVNGIAVDTSKEGDKRYIHLELNPAGSKENSNIVKVEFKNIKNVVTDSILSKQNQYQGLSGAKELEKLHDLKGQTIKAYMPFKLPSRFYDLKDYIDLKDRDVITEKVLNIVRDKDDVFLEVKHQDEIVKIHPSDIVEVTSFEKESSYEKILFQNQLLQAINLKGKTVSMSSDSKDEPLITGEVEKVSTENSNVFLTLKSGNKTIKINFNNLKEI